MTFFVTVWARRWRGGSKAQHMFY